MSPASFKPPRRLALADCNNFYVSCERVFQPAWEQRPVGVLSNNDGCIIARSNELKAAGIPMGAPYFQFRQQLTAMNAVVVSSNYALYADLSARVMHTLGQFTPDLEPYSIDEAWLDLTGFDPASLDAYGRHIATTTRRQTGIPVSIGIGPTKVLAKIANRVCKTRQLPGQVFNLGSEDHLDAVLSAVAIQDVWGIGRRWAETLQADGIGTALALRNADPSSMRRRYSVVMQRLILELRGVPCLEREDLAPKQQIMVSRTFGARVTDLATLVAAVTSYVTRAGEKLRAQDSACGGVQVSIYRDRHPLGPAYEGRSAFIQFSVATADTRTLIRAARQGVERLFQQGCTYAKAGVMLVDLVPAGSVQAGLFEAGDAAPSAPLMAVVDRVNRRYGHHTLFFAGAGTQRTWAMKQTRRTPAFTTRWKDIPSVR